MGMFSRSWALAKQSFAVLRQNPTLMVFPIISAIVTILLTASFAMPIYMMTGFKDFEKLTPVMRYSLSGGYYFISYFIVIFFNSAMVSCAHESLNGRQTSVGDGLVAAWKRLPTILGWALIASTVGMILKLVSEQTGAIGRLIVSLVGATWIIATFFVIPVLVVEDASPVRAVKKSIEVLKRTWGEKIVGGAGIGLVVLLMALGPVLPIIVAFMLAPPVVGFVLLGLSVVYWLGLATVATSMQSIYQTALYIYATDGTAPAGFTQESITAAFKEKPVSKFGRFGR